MPSRAAWSMYAAGGMALSLGVIATMVPDMVLGHLGMDPSPQTQETRSLGGFAMPFVRLCSLFGRQPSPLPKAANASADFTRLFARMLSMALINMAAYYCYAAYHEVNRFFEIAIPLRLFTATYCIALHLAGNAPKVVAQLAVLEALGALWTAWAIYRDTGTWVGARTAHSLFKGLSAIWTKPKRGPK
eukprot:TRINITY_DN23779_c0_g1_i1.p1 TRINITY_DN23779_c0_g1~~TRINITY_DN23779_c0_g1_i1.p1  ORF type:complete len:188 (+),score=20.22 TRINITY_DN23779_c0_g1_i1:195-758(+)